MQALKLYYATAACVVLYLDVTDIEFRLRELIRIACRIVFILLYCGRGSGNGSFRAGIVFHSRRLLRRTENRRAQNNERGGEKLMFETSTCHPNALRWSFLRKRVGSLRRNCPSATADGTDKTCTRENLRPSVLLKSYRNKFRNADFLHSHTIECTRHFHGSLVMSNDNELRICRHLRDFISESSDVRFVKGCVDFVQQTER